MTGPAISGGRLELLFFERLAPVAGKAHAHVKLLAAVHIVTETGGICTAAMAIGALDTRSGVDPMVEHHVVGQAGLVHPRLGGRLRQGRIQNHDARILGERQTVAVHAIGLRRHKGMGRRTRPRMALRAVKTYGIAVERMLERDERSRMHRSRGLPEQEIRKQKSGYHPEYGDGDVLHRL